MIHIEELTNKHFIKQDTLSLASNSKERLTLQEATITYTAVFGNSVLSSGLRFNQVNTLISKI